jgi:hypothetical protein
MKPDPASLENLRDIAVPPPVPWWPPAPGWWMVMAVLVIAIIVVAFRAWRRWRANAYRRAALRELQRATTLAGIAEILKRAALVACRRTDIAALSGSAWCRWLAETAGGPVPDNVAEALTRGVFGKADDVNVGEVSAFATDWIRGHACKRRDGKDTRAAERPKMRPHAERGNEDRSC